MNGGATAKHHFKGRQAGRQVRGSNSERSTGATAAGAGELGDLTLGRGLPLTEVRKDL